MKFFSRFLPVVKIMRGKLKGDKMYCSYLYRLVFPDIIEGDYCCLYRGFFVSLYDDGTTSHSDLVSWRKYGGYWL